MTEYKELHISQKITEELHISQKITEELFCINKNKIQIIFFLAKNNFHYFKSPLIQKQNQRG